MFSFNLQALDLVLQDLRLLIADLPQHILLEQNLDSMDLSHFVHYALVFFLDNGVMLVEN